MRTISTIMLIIGILCALTGLFFLPAMQFAIFIILLSILAEIEGLTKLKK